MKLSLSFVLILPFSVQGFIFESNVKPELVNIADAQPSQLVGINLDIGQEGSSSRLGIKGMKIDLRHDVADYEHVLMPGENGPNPELSSGTRKLNLIKEGEFVSLAGSQMVKALKGCWELIWKKNVPAGSLLCGFEIPEEYRRNEAKLPPGEVYLSFSVWTRETLASARKQKKKILAKAKEALNAKDQAMEKYACDPNPFKKLLHYREAMLATERYWLQPVKAMQAIPEDDEIIQLQNDLFCTTKGSVWSKSLPHGQKVPLGTANLVPIPQDA